MIGLSANLRSLAFIAVASFAAFCTVKAVTCPGHAPATKRASVTGCHKAKRSAPRVDVAQFGTAAFTDEGEYIFTETDRVVLTPGTPFGWRLHLAQPMETVRLKEVFVLPQAPRHWGIGPETTLSDDGTTAVTEEVVDPVGGWIARTWSVSPGDPTGPYEMRVYLNDRLVKVFAFQGDSPPRD